MSRATPSAQRRRTSGVAGTTADNDLETSLRQLSLSTASQANSPAKPSSPLAGARPAAGSSAAGASSRRTSSAGSPALLRKASLNSLHAASPTGGGAHKPPLRRASSSNLRSPSVSGTHPSSPMRSPLAGNHSSANSNGNSHQNGYFGSNGFDPLREEEELAAAAAAARPPPPPTAASIAHSHFATELALHHENSDHAAAVAAETLVVLHDSCYGHRYARPRTSRANLSTIVERPERIQACAVGVSAAYVRLGERHAGGAYMPHPRLDPASIPSAPFRIRKTTRKLPLLAPAVTNVHGSKWMEELGILCDSAEAKLALNGKELQRPDMDRGGHGHHSSSHSSHNSTPPAKLHEGDLYLCAESRDALEGALGGVCEAVDAVLGSSKGAPEAEGPRPKRAFVGIRPPGHHCSNSWPSGFCWINNVHIGIMHGILNHGLNHAAIVDFDLHHGDGSQAIAWAHNMRSVTMAKNASPWKKTSIGYFSLHDINSFPCEMGDEEKVKNASLCIENAHGQNIWNVHLEPWKTVAEFWQHYETKYTILLEKLRAFLQRQAERWGPQGRGAIFISAGFDACEWETASMQRHKVNVPTEFYARFTRDVVRIAEATGNCVDGRVISVMEGGYSDRAIFSGVLSHLSGLAGTDPATKDEAYHSGLGYEMGHRMGAIPKDDPDSGGRPAASAPAYDPAWFAAEELDLIEAALAPPPPAAEPKPAAPAPTYWSPTQSSQAKVVATPKIRRSASGMSSSGYGSGYASSPVSRPPTPPPPEVPWTVAFHELSKLLIPLDRTTTSCTVEDLSAEATRARRDRQSLLTGTTTGTATTTSTPLATPQTPAPTRVSMRERKQVKPYGSEATKEAERKSRRKTVAGSAIHATEKPTTRGRPKPGRRLSAASSAVSEAGESDTVIGASSEGPSTRPPSSSAEEMPPPARFPAATGAPGVADAVPSTPVPPLAMKKTRPTGSASSSRFNTPAKTPAAKPAVAKTPRTTKKVASTSTTGTAGSGTTSRKSSAVVVAATTAAASSASTATTASATTTTLSTADDVDKLTTSMRKIKIHVVTAAEKDAREKAKKDKEDKEAAASATSAAASHTVASSTTSDYSEPVKTPTSDATLDADTSHDAGSTHLLAHVSPSAAPALSTLPSVPAWPATPVAQTVRGPVAGAEDLTDSADSTDAADEEHYAASASPADVDSPSPSAYAAASDPAPTLFVPYQPEGATPAALPQTHPLQWMPPNEAATPTPATRTKKPAKAAVDDRSFTEPEEKARPADVKTQQPGHEGTAAQANSKREQAEVAVAQAENGKLAAETQARRPVTPTAMKREDLPVFTATSTIPFAFSGGGVRGQPPSTPARRLEEP